MKADNRFLNELFRIINGALRLDIDKVRNYTAYLAEKLEESGDKASAAHLRKLLKDSEHQLHPTGISQSRMVPVDSETRFPLLEKIDIKSKDEVPVMLSESHWNIINEFTSIAKSYAQVDAQGLVNSLTLLMYGPPGTGKTRLGRYIAKELGLDLYIARLDGLISSYLGSTSKNIRSLFDFAAKNPCVLFLDEFDAIAKLRGDSQELGELKRVVNSFIQNLDSLSSQSIVIAATNHPELLDAAIWRRFSYRLELDYPNQTLRQDMWQKFLPPVRFSEKEVALLVDLSEGFSGADIQDVCTRLKRKKIVQNETPVFKDAFFILKNISLGGENNKKNFLSAIQNKEEEFIIKALRERNPNLYSFNAVGDIFGFSKSKAHRLSK
ncbi:MAG TPA: ATP-binding protein [Chitinophagaceae bacterium]|nr:ATP-binding protein [Chitinophagaceae bacterium]